MSSAQTDDTDLLWLLSSDLFPFQSLLMEGQSTIHLDGRVWAMDEVPQQERLDRQGSKQAKGLKYIYFSVVSSCYQKLRNVFGNLHITTSVFRNFFN